MDIILILIAGLFIAGMRPQLDGPKPGYLARDTTATINGLFILLVMFSHFMTYLPDAGRFARLANIWMATKGELIVATFLFFSGYGIMEQIKRRGHTYVDTFPVRRIFFVWAKFVAAVTVFLVIGLLTRRAMTLSQVLLSYLGLSSIGNSSWYIFAILLMYIVTYFAFKICGQHTRAAFAVMLALSLVYSVVAFKTLPDYYFETILCYFAGMVLSRYKSGFDVHVGRSWATYLSVAALTAIVFVGTYLTCARTTGLVHYAMYEIAAIAFAMLFVLLTMKFRLHNPLLRYMGGSAMFSIYVLQRIPMMFGSQTVLLGHPELFFVFVAVVTVILGWLFDRVVDQGLRKVTGK